MKIIISMLLCLVFTAGAGAQEIEGQWIGTMKVPGAALRIVFNVKRVAGKYVTTLDSPSRGARGMRMSETSFEAGKVIISGGKGFVYAGELKEDGCIAGVLEEGGKMFPVELSRVAKPDLSLERANRNYTGTWSGALALPHGMSLRVVFHVSKYGDEYISAMDSPDQGARGTPVEVTRVAGDSIVLEIPVIDFVYRGAWSEAGHVAGVLKQAGQVFPLNLARGEKPVARNRPQEPRGPLPYRVEEVRFVNAADSVVLAGTLTLPEGARDSPVAVLVSGSGPQDRDERMEGHKPFLVLADYLTRRGVGVLRFDDRGTGESTGDFHQSSFWDFARDVRAAVDFLRRERGVKRVGLVGHSEGAQVAAIVAGRGKDIRFVVSLGGVGVRGDTLFLSQQEAIWRDAGMPDSVVQSNLAANRVVFDILLKGAPREEMEGELERFLRVYYQESAGGKQAGVSEEDFVVERMEAILSPSMYQTAIFDPFPVWRKVKCPVLALNGSNDLQVLPGINLAGIRKGLSAARNRKATIKELPGLNHLFQECDTGSIARYGQIEQTMSPAVLGEVGDWIREVMNMDKE